MTVNIGYQCANGTGTVTLNVTHNATGMEYGPSGGFALTCTNSSQQITVNFPPANDTWNSGDACVVLGVFKFDGSSAPQDDNINTTAHRLTN